MKKTIFLDLYGTIINDDKLGAFLNRIGLSQLKPKMLENSLEGLELMKDENLILMSEMQCENCTSQKSKIFDDSQKLKFLKL